MQVLAINKSLFKVFLFIQSCSPFHVEGELIILSLHHKTITLVDWPYFSVEASTSVVSQYYSHLLSQFHHLDRTGYWVKDTGRCWWVCMPRLWMFEECPWKEAKNKYVKPIWGSLTRSLTCFEADVSLVGVEVCSSYKLLFICQLKILWFAVRFLLLTKTWTTETFWLIESIALVWSERKIQ